MNNDYLFEFKVSNDRVMEYAEERNLCNVFKFCQSLECSRIMETPILSIDQASIKADEVLKKLEYAYVQGIITEWMYEKMIIGCMTSRKALERVKRRNKISIGKEVENS